MIIQPSTAGIFENPREFREFQEAKARKREKIRLIGHGAMAASSNPKNRRQFDGLMMALRDNKSFARCAETVAALSREIVRFGGTVLPVPNEVIQNENCTLSLFWDGASAIMGDGRIVWFIGGSDGVRGTGIHPDLCRQLVFLQAMREKHAQKPSA